MVFVLLKRRMTASIFLLPVRHLFVWVSLSECSLLQACTNLRHILNAMLLASHYGFFFHLNFYNLSMSWVYEFMVWHQVVILLYWLYLFDKSVFSQVSTSEILISIVRNFTFYLPFSIFFQYLLSCAKEHIDYYIIVSVYFRKFWKLVHFPQSS